MRTFAAILGLSLVAAAAPAVTAQSLGTFGWQLLPYCNVVRFAVTPDGSVFRLTGDDDQCGAGKVPAAGVATANADGTFTLAFYLITPQGAASHTTALLAPGSISGPWKDDGGFTGTLIFGPPSGTGGTPRPVAGFQRRVIGACGVGEFMQKVREDGGVECAAAANPGGITAVAAGTGLTGGGTSGDLTLAIAAGGVGSIQIADGAIGAADVDASQLQRRVGPACTAGLFLSGVGADGSTTCSAGAGASNVAVGGGSLGLNTSGAFNVAVGSLALQHNVTGQGNTAVGANALGENVSGASNTSIGWRSLRINTSGNQNVAVGHQALVVNTDGDDNTAVGFNALQWNNSGSGNTAIGRGALGQVAGGSNNLAIGDLAGVNLTTGSNSIFIGSQGSAVDPDTIRIGSNQARAFVAGIRGRTTGAANAVAVMIDSNGQLGTVSSSRRTKDDIHDMGSASAGLFRLRPVTFRYVRPYADGSTPRDYGLIAEEVEAVYPDLVVRNDAGTVETVQYHKLVPMLLNEVQRQQREIARLREALGDQRTAMAAVQSRLDRVESRPR